MEVLTSKNRMSAPHSSCFTLAKMSSLDYYSVSNGLAVTQQSKDPFITYCLTLTFILLCAFPLVTYFKDSILQRFSCIRDSIHHISFYIAHIFNILSGLYTIWKELKQLQHQDQHFSQPKTSKLLIQISPLLDEFLTKVREQLIVFSSTEQTSSIPNIQQECSGSQVFQKEQLLILHTPNIFIEWTYSSPAICNDPAFTKFVQGEERCLKFINQDLTFLQSSSIPSTFSNISNAVSASAKVKEPTCIQLLTHIPQQNSNTPPTQTIEPVLGFTPAEICSIPLN